MQTKKSLEGMSKDPPLNLTDELVLALLNNAMSSGSPDQDPPPQGGGDFVSC